MVINGLFLYIYYKIYYIFGKYFCQFVGCGDSLNVEIQIYSYKFKYYIQGFEY